jgi:Zinc carboxypeptidase
MMIRDKNLIHAIATLLLVLAAWASGAETRRSRPRTPNVQGHTFPALGASDERKVEIAWNRFHDHKGLGAILTHLNMAFPELTKLYSIGTSSEGRDIWCLEVTARSVGDPDRKPGMYIDGNIHGNEVQAGEVVVYTAWYLCHQYGRLDKITELLDDRVFYLFPTINPDGRDYWLGEAHQASSSRSGLEPTDNDRDGRADEDDLDDLNGDGFITQMRKKDPQGRYKPHPDYPEYRMVRAKADEPGQYTRLGWEGIDNDGDGRINEDGRGGYDLNRNWGFDWQPSYVQYGAKDYPFSQPETRAIADFVLAHPNIAGAQAYHNAGGMILRGPGRAGGDMQRGDERVLELIAERGESILPYYRSMVVEADLYTVWGGSIDWLYGARGMFAFTNELWTRKNLYKRDSRPSQDEEAEFIEHVLLGDGVVPWQPYEHPTYGAIEIGGLKKEWGRIPVSFLLEEELHRNMAFTLYHAEMLPLLQIGEIHTESLASDLFKVWVTVENQRLIPTRARQDVIHHISPPDVVSIQGDDLDVLSAGRIVDRFFKEVQAVKRRPERVELDTIDGMDAARVQFIVKGSGPFVVTVDSAKGGLFRKDGALP